MTIGLKCVLKGVSRNKIINHDYLMKRICKSFYYGRIDDYDDMEVSRPLAEYTSELFSEPHKGHSLNRLNVVTVGGIRAYPCTLIIALIYLDRLNASDPSFIRRITPSELFIVSMMISTKFYCGYDEDVYLSEWAEQGSITEKRLKQLEIEFLCSIDWNIYLSRDQFFEKLKSIEKILALREGVRRGWLTYNELLILLPPLTIAKFFLNNIVVIAVSYAASVVTIAGAFFLLSNIPGNALTKDQTSSAEINVSKIKELCENISQVQMADILSNEHGIELCQALNKEELENFERKFSTEIEEKSTYENNLPISGNRCIIRNSKIIMKNTNLKYYNFNYVKNNLTESIFRNNGKSLIEIPFAWFKFI